MPGHVGKIAVTLSFAAFTAAGAALADGPRLIIRDFGDERTANLGGFPVPQEGFAGVTGGGRDYWHGWRHYHGFEHGHKPPEFGETRDPDRAERIQRDIEERLNSR